MNRYTVIISPMKLTRRCRERENRFVKGKNMNQTFAFITRLRWARLAYDTSIANRFKRVFRYTLDGKVIKRTDPDFNPSVDIPAGKVTDMDYLGVDCFIRVAQLMDQSLIHEWDVAKEKSKYPIEISKEQVVREFYDE